MPSHIRRGRTALKGRKPSVSGSASPTNSAHDFAPLMLSVSSMSGKIHLRRVIERNVRPTRLGT